MSHGQEPLIEELRAGERGLAWSLPDATWRAEIGTPPRGILPGSFNPLHEGHLALWATAERLLGAPVGFELSMFNADKPPLSVEDLENRRRQRFPRPLAVTAAPTFADKARLLPGTTFVVGADTALRIVDARFYAGRPEQMRRALAAIRTSGCRFLVAGRQVGSAFITLAEVPLPPGCEGLFDAIPPELFRRDISSTDLRIVSRTQRPQRDRRRMR